MTRAVFHGYSKGAMERAFFDIQKLAVGGSNRAFSTIFSEIYLGKDILLLGFLRLIYLFLPSQFEILSDFLREYCSLTFSCTGQKLSAFSLLKKSLLFQKTFNIKPLGDFSLPGIVIA